MSLFRCSHAKNVEDLERELGKVKAENEELRAKVEGLDADEIVRRTGEILWKRLADERKRAELRRREAERERDVPIMPPL